MQNDEVTKAEEVFPRFERLPSDVIGI